MSRASASPSRASAGRAARRVKARIPAGLAGLTVSMGLAGVIALLAACHGGPPAPPSPDADADVRGKAAVQDAVSDVGRFTGGYDEIIGAPDAMSPGFSDADYAQLLLPDDIAPIYAPTFSAAGDAEIPGDELVIGLVINGDARAYPAGILYAREMVNDVVGGTPVLVSWCPRCYTALVYDRRVGGSALTFGNQGALYQGAMTWYDHATGSVWSQPLGRAIAGARAGARLELIPSELTGWAQWVAAHPATLLLTTPEPSPAFRGRRPGADHVAGIVIGESAAAWPYASLTTGEIIEGNVGGIPVALWRDAATGGIRATRLHRPDGSAMTPQTAADLMRDGPGRNELPVRLAYRSAWLKFYPGSTIRDSTSRGSTSHHRRPVIRRSASPSAWRSSRRPVSFSRSACAGSAGCGSAPCAG